LYNAIHKQDAHHYRFYFIRERSLYLSSSIWSVMKGSVFYKSTAHGHLRSNPRPSPPIHRANLQN
jgi:hypothetical protein